ncbi:MAG: universal stress protein [Candidatus Rokubacteria bacterium]|nr:universal stress protein [Candidatus Rokubacteria bacterium]
MKLDTILVPLDGSWLAETALSRAVELARASDAELLLVRAAEAHSLPGADPTEGQIKVIREAEEYLAGVRAHLASLGFTKVETSVWYGPAAYSIVEAARLRKANLIVMTTHGRSGLGRLIMGSVAESVLRGTTIPILLLRAPEAPIEPPAKEGEARPWSTLAHV